MLLGLEIPRSRVTIDGPIRTYQSSAFAERAWCETCGSAVWFADTSDNAEDIVELTAGLFDDFGGARLTRVVYADRCPAGIVLGAGFQRVTEAEYERDNAHIGNGKKV